MDEIINIVLTQLHKQYHEHQILKKTDTRIVILLNHEYIIKIDKMENLIAEYYFYTHTHWMYLPTVFLLNTEKGFLVSSYISGNLPNFYKQEVLTSLRFSRICICKEYYWLWLSFSPHTNMA